MGEIVRIARQQNLGKDRGNLVQLPSPPPNLVCRPHLEDHLEDVESATLTLIRAPAGYGKTCLLTQWQQTLSDRGHKVVALRALPPDGSSQSARGNLVATQHAGQGMAESIINVPAGAFSGRCLEEYLQSVIAQMTGPVFLLIDDAHHLEDARPADWLVRLVGTKLPDLHVILSTRHAVNLPLSRLRVSSALVEIDSRDLRFRNDEAANLFRANGLEFGNLEIAALVARSGGWPAGLRLALLAARRAEDPRAVLAEFSGEWQSVVDFFAEEVLGQESVALRQFLLRTSVLQRFSAPLCDALLENNGKAGRSRYLIEQCRAHGLFIEPFDDRGEWFGYNPAFAGALSRHLRQTAPEDYRNLHQRASRWLMQHGYVSEAFDQAIWGGEFDLAADIIDAASDDLQRSGNEQTVLALAERLPKDVRQNHPRVMLAVAWQLTAMWQIQNSRALIDASRVRIDMMARDTSCDASELAVLRHLLVHREMKLNQIVDDMPTVEQQATVLLSDQAIVDGHIKASTYGSLLFARREQYKLGELDRLHAEAREQLRCSDSLLIRVFLEAIVGPSYFLAGRTDAAIRSLEAGIDFGVRFGGIGSSHAAICTCSLAEVLYERGDTERSLALLEALDLEKCELGFVDQFIANWTTRSRLAKLRGDIGGALGYLEKGMEFANANDLARLRWAILCEQLRLSMQSGHFTQAEILARDSGLDAARVSVLPAAFSTTRDEARAYAWVLLAELQGRYSEARSVAERWRGFVVAAGAVRSGIRWSIIQARLLLATGQRNAAQKALVAAIALAAPGRYRRSFLDEGRWLESLLKDLFPTSAVVDDPAAAFGTEVHAAFRRECVGPAPQIDKKDEEWQGFDVSLGPRELDVLKMVAAGMLNREIGKRLAMTEGSVKWYLQQIYDKMGTRRRVRAVERARQLGLLSV